VFASGALINGSGICDVSATVPVELGNVTTGDPAIAGAESVTDPDVSPETTRFAMLIPLIPPEGQVDLDQ
jgi:hypothetical protein